jgi:hypothetical protein
MKTRIALLTAALATAAQAGIVYQNDFEAGLPGSPWTGNVRIENAAPFGRFLGRYSEIEGVAIQFEPPQQGLGAGESFRYTATFDLYAIDSWDGDAGGDRFLVSSNMNILFDETISNVGGTQSLRAPDVGPAHMGFNAQYKDAIYRDLSVTFYGGPAELMKLKWRGEAMQGMTDESWGIDNVKVTWEVIPAPGSMALLGLGALLMVRRKR